MRIKVSHESPLQLLDYSVTYNDYDYALVHLFDKYPDYYDFFKTNLKQHNRTVYLDNSIFELGHSFDPQQYSHYVDELNPTYYIVPDVLEECMRTMEAYEEWLHLRDRTSTSHHELSERPKAIGVVQGKDWYDIKKCYMYMADQADMIAISFDYSYYLLTGDSTITSHQSELDWRGYLNDMHNVPEVDNPMNSYQVMDQMQRYKSGRIALINRLIQENIWRWDKPHHLLGCGLASEFSHYVNNNIYNIVSVDTSNPIVAAMQGYKYHDDQGLSSKPSIKLADLIDSRVSDDELQTLMQRVKYNTDCFKKIINRA